MSSPLGLPPHGVISNLKTVLNEIDTLIDPNTSSPCDVEYLWVEGSFPGNFLGHSAIAYTHPETGARTVMNIVGKATNHMVNFTSQREYIFGLEDLEKGEQGGIYNRTIYGLRIEKVPAQDVLAMHYQYVALQHESRAGRATFNIAAGAGIPLLRSVLNRALPFVDNGARLGNCALWTSMGLVRAGLLPRTSLFPKHMMARLLMTTSPTNMNLVKYCKVTAVPCHRLFPNAHPPCRGILTPLHVALSYIYRNLDSYVNYTVSVTDPHTHRADVKHMPNASCPPRGIFTRYSHYTLMVCAILLLDRYGNRSSAIAFGVAAAVIW